MPTLISETDVKLERGDMLRRIPLDYRRTIDEALGFIVPPARTPGLHLSGLLKYIAEKSRITTRIAEIADEEHPWRWAMGLAWEEFAASLYPAMTWQPGEVADPVIMTCDGIEEGRCIREFKFNRSKKYKGPDLIQKKWLWMQQGLGYCLGYGYSVVQWDVLSVLEFPDPVCTQYLIEFSPKEIADSRRMILANRDGAIREGYSE
jgi:hypothetical protein